MIEPRLTDTILTRIEAALARPHRAPLMIGISGAQGSGKSTLVAALAEQLTAAGRRVATLSLDDLYLPRAERLRLAEQVHPLLATRGVPGTHDVALGRSTIAALERGEGAPLPRFAKGLDDRLPSTEWPNAPENCEVLLLEGWCLGARAQADLAASVNALEAAEDPTAIWRSYANTALAGDYQHLFARIDLLVMLAAPDWTVVAKWREQQEAALRITGGVAVMNPAEVARFIQHYERLTRWMLQDLPARADLVVRLGADREVLAISKFRSA